MLVQVLPSYASLLKILSHERETLSGLDGSHVPGRG